ncbi:MAG: ATP-binding protein [Desulfobacteraceae bacterium]|nr:ATP-binding protein [Desulfobacteraceae bacterium]
MLDNFKRIKKISDMAEGEKAYIQLGGLVSDEHGRLWLNLEGKVSTKGGSVITPVIKRTGKRKYDFEIDNNNAYTPYSVESEILKNDSSCICLDDFFEVGLKADIEIKKAESIKEKLSPLYNIFLNDEILNQVLINTNIPEITRGEKPVFSGVILYGEGGTGKTSLQKAIGGVYKNCGAIAEELNVASMSEKFIGSLGNNLDKKIGEINKESEKRNVPAFIFLDEATSLVMSRETHNSSSADYYQEAVDVLKKYISNYPNLVFSITTNAMPDIYDDTLVREGRLLPVLIPLPGMVEKTKMWEFFLDKYEIIKNLDKSCYQKLAEISSEEKGSFISEFAKGYIPGKKLEEETRLSNTSSILDSLSKGVYASIEKVKEKINFDIIFADLEKAVSKGRKRNRLKNQIGFKRFEAV